MNMVLNDVTVREDETAEIAFSMHLGDKLGSDVTYAVGDLEIAQIFLAYDPAVLALRKKKGAFQDLKKITGAGERDKVPPVDEHPYDPGTVNNA